MSVFLGATVVHRCRISLRKWRGITACGQRFRLPNARLNLAGKFRDEFPVPHCSHCQNRIPPWERRQKKTAEEPV